MPIRNDILIIEKRYSLFVKTGPFNVNLIVNKDNMWNAFCEKQNCLYILNEMHGLTKSQTKIMIIGTFDTFFALQCQFNNFFKILTTCCNRITKRPSPAVIKFYNLVFGWQHIICCTYYICYNFVLLSNMWQATRTQNLVDCKPRFLYKQLLPNLWVIWNTSFLLCHDSLCLNLPQA